MPPGTQPPLIIRYSASSVPILQLSIGSDTLPEQQLFDIAINQLRTQLVTVPGVQIPYPYGGKQRQVMVDLDPEKLYAYGISPADVTNADQRAEPDPARRHGEDRHAGISRSGSTPARRRSTALNDLPIKTVNGTTVYIRDVAHVRDGFQVQTNIVHADGKRGVLLSILKQGNASTLDVVNGVKKALPEAQTALPHGTEDHAAVRPVGLRPRQRRGRGEGSRDRRRADRR